MNFVANIPCCTSNVLYCDSDSFMRRCSQVSTQMLIKPDRRQSGRLTLFLSRSSDSNPVSSLKLLSPACIVCVYPFHLSRNLSLVVKCHPGPGSWRMIGEGPDTGESTETITLYSPVFLFSLSRMVKNFSRLGKRFYLLFGRTNSEKTNEKPNCIIFYILSAFIVWV